MKRILIANAFAGVALVCGAADFDVADQTEFNNIIAPGAKIARLATDMKFVEGPVWVPDGDYLIFSDIPANQLKKWSPEGGLSTFREPSNKANGNTLDREGRLMSAEHGARRVSRTEKDGMVVTVVDSYDGKKLNSPNDVVVKSDGSVWFTDPDYGLEGRPKEQPGNYVYRFDPKDKSVTAVATDFDKPNGLCFSPDESQLYIADSGRPRHIRVFNVARDGKLDAGKVFCSIDKGGPDGIRCDADGRIWTSSGHGAQVFGPDGKLIVTINLPEAGANLCFGGADGKTLFVTARKSLYSVPTLVKSATRP